MASNPEACAEVAVEALCQAEAALIRSRSARGQASFECAICTVIAICCLTLGFFLSGM